MTRKKAKIPEKRKVYTGGQEYNYRTGQRGDHIFITLPPRTPKKIKEAAQKIAGRYDLGEVTRGSGNTEWEIMMHIDDYARTDEDHPETFQWAKDEREGVWKWVKKNLGRKWTSVHHEKGLYSILKAKPTKKPSLAEVRDNRRMSEQSGDLEGRNRKAMTKRKPKMVDMTAQVMGGLKKVQAGKGGKFASTPARRPKRKSSAVPIRLKSQNQKDWIAFGIKELKDGDYYDVKGSGKRQNKELFNAVRAANSPEEIVEILDSIGIEVMSTFYDDHRPVMGGAFSKKRGKAKQSGSFPQLMENIQKIYGVGGMSGAVTTLLGFHEGVEVVVRKDQADRLGKNLSSQVAKYKKRHNSPWTTRMVRLNRGKRVVFTIKRKTK